MAESKSLDAALVLEFPALKYVPKRYVSTKRKLTDPVAFFENNVEPQWGEKQKQVLTTWLNKVLTPPIPVDELDEAGNRQFYVDPKEILAEMKKTLNGGAFPQPVVPTKEEVSLQMYVSQYWIDRLRVKSSELYATLEPLLSKIDDAVDNQKITVRRDKNIYNDVGLQRFVLGVLLSLYPLWLRIGLETVYGEEIGEIKGKAVHVGLSYFILQRMFNDPVLQRKFGFNSVIHYYKEEYGQEVGKFFVKKFLRLFIFLDYAKKERLMKHDPCLFRRNSPCKSIKDVFSALTTEALSGDGNLFKLLTKIGYTCGYSQSYVDEFHYVVKDISHDLRDGVILCRIMELVTGDYSLMSKLRCPPISILQKVHNVSTTLKVLTEQGVLTNDLAAKKVVEGHLEQTLKLVKRMMGKFSRIKIGDNTAQLGEIFISFQAHCKGFLLRRRFAQLLAEEEEERQRKETSDDSEEAGVSTPSDLSEEQKVVDEEQVNNNAAFLIQRWWKKILLSRPLKPQVKTDPKSGSSAVYHHLSDHRDEMEGQEKTVASDDSEEAVVSTQKDLDEKQKAADEEQLKSKAAFVIQRWWKMVLLSSRLKSQLNTSPQSESLGADHYRLNYQPAVEELTTTDSSCSLPESRENQIDHEAIQLDRIFTVFQAHCKGYARRELLAEKKKQSAMGIMNENMRNEAALKVQRWWRKVLLEGERKKQSQVQRQIVSSNDSEQIVGVGTLLQARCEDLLRQVFMDLGDEVDTKITQEEEKEEEVEKEKEKKEEGEEEEKVEEEKEDEEVAIVYTQLREQEDKQATDNRKGEEWAAVVIQNWWKKVITAHRLQRQQKIIDDEITRNRSASIIRRWWKSAVSLRKWKKVIAQEKAKHRAAMTIQAAWRGFRFRRNSNNFPAIVEEVRQRIAAATEAATAQQTVSARTLTGLDYFLNYESLNLIRKGLEELVVVTRLSATSCVQLVEKGAVRVLFELIHQMNLSVASQVITWLSVSVLFNLAKCTATRPSVATISQWPMKLVSLLQKFQDSGREDVFVKVALLIIVMTQSAYAMAEIDSCKMAMQKLFVLRSTFARRADRKREQERQKLFQQRGKATVVLEERRAGKKANIWEGKAIQFTPDWMLGSEKPNEDISKEDAMAWLAHVVLDKM